MRVRPARCRLCGPGGCVNLVRPRRPDNTNKRLIPREAIDFDGQAQWHLVLNCGPPGFPLHGAESAAMAHAAAVNCRDDKSAIGSFASSQTIRGLKTALSLHIARSRSGARIHV